MQIRSNLGIESTPGRRTTFTVVHGEILLLEAMPSTMPSLRTLVPRSRPASRSSTCKRRSSSLLPGAWRRRIGSVCNRGVPELIYYLERHGRRSGASATAPSTEGTGRRRQSADGNEGPVFKKCWTQIRGYFENYWIVINTRDPNKGFQ
ncbi:hypothetical protein SEVIR_9G153766v4 [Setaria viridis]